MTSRCVNPKCRKNRLRPAYLAVAGLAALIAAGDHAAARGGSSERPIESIQSRSAGEPVMAIVSLRNQRITVYDAKGWILRAPVSSGTTGRETPAGIFSVIQKVEEHYSNLYDDAFMPHMQRITWSGIALHGGVLPGRPASHGCVRLPFDFAGRLFDVTAMGMRVIVAPTDVVPVELAHPLLFQPKPGVAALAASRAAEAQQATKKAAEARLAAGTALREATQARVPVRAAENLKRVAEAQLAAAETKLGSGTSAEAKEQAADRQGAGRRQDRGTAAAMGCRQRGSATEARCRYVCAGCRRHRRDGARRGGRGGRPGRTRTPAGIGVDQPQDPAALCPAGIQAHPRNSGHDRRPGSSHRHACLHRHRAHDRRRQLAMERRLIGRWRRRGRATRPAARQ